MVGLSFVVCSGVACGDEVARDEAPLNAPPTLVVGPLVVHEDETGVVGVQIADPEGAPLTLGASTPGHGVVVIGDVVTYRPVPDYTGDDRFTLTVSDGEHAVSAEVGVTVLPVDDPPVADDLAVTTEQDTEVAIVLTGRDVDGAIEGFELVSGPTRGLVTGTPPTLVYTPAFGYVGADRITFAVKSDGVSSAVGTVTIVVQERVECGDGIVQGGEACDDDDLETETCALGTSCRVCAADCTIRAGVAAEGGGCVEAFAAPIPEGLRVGTVVDLDASASTSAFGEVVGWRWSVLEQPDGADVVVFPSAEVEAPNAELVIPGSYRFGLSVEDALGNGSGSAACPDAQVSVVVVAPALRVELAWGTAESFARGGDAADGIDLDLHFSHEDATGPDLDGDGAPDPWFDQQWDVFWFNRSPTWGSFDPAAEHPILYAPDEGGSHVPGEHMEWWAPIDDVVYTVGVHAWEVPDVAVARVRVWSDGALVSEATLPAMEAFDMWCVGRIRWPDPTLHRCAAEGEPEQVSPDYINPFFRPPTPR